jgi:hypothetical protein
VTPAYTPIAIPLLGTQKLNWAFTGVPIGTELCVRVFIHTPNLSECCDVVVCATVTGDCPGCGGAVNCDDIDFNNDGLFPDDADLVDFLNVLAGGICSNDPLCNDIDFNNDGLFPDDGDLLSFLSILSGGTCR